MRIEIRSKSGNYNSERDLPGIGTLKGALKVLRSEGGYYASDRQEREVFVPFEEVEFITKGK
jgi:hypothetical protein